jgi:hypothetical protein
MTVVGRGCAEWIFFFVRKPEGRENLKHVGVYDRIILKCIFKE